MNPGLKDFKVRMDYGPPGGLLKIMKGLLVTPPSPPPPQEGNDYKTHKFISEKGKLSVFILVWEWAYVSPVLKLMWN